MDGPGDDEDGAHVAEKNGGSLRLIAHAIKKAFCLPRKFSA
jgi:hypothetical protein